MNNYSPPLSDNKKELKDMALAPHILIIDDEPLVCWSLENSLSKKGYRLTTINTGEQAIQLLSSGRFDLVITDLELPSVDGFEVAMAVKRYLPNVPIIMISASSDPNCRERAKELSIEYYIDKPFNLDEISDLIFKLLN
jgi:CheY-like chemotaxis protein